MKFANILALAKIEVCLLKGYSILSSFMPRTNWCVDGKDENVGWLSWQNIVEWLNYS